MNKKTFIPLSLIFLFASVAVIALARTEKRVALVWGNAVYEGWDNLPVCTNDADAVGKTLYELGFDTIMLKNGNREEMNESLRRFENECMGTDVAVFFYSGHAFNKSSIYYLVPSKTEIDCKSPRAIDCFQAQAIVDGITSNATLSLFFFDACRVTGGEMGSAKGLSVPMDIGPDDEKDQKAKGCTIYYATHEDQRALTGNEGDLSVFTRILVSHLPDTSEFRTVWPKISREVRIITGDAQQPSSQDVYSHNFYFNPSPKTPLYQSEESNILYRSETDIPCDELLGKYKEVVAELELSKVQLNMANEELAILKSEETIKLLNDSIQETPNIDSNKNQISNPIIDKNEAYIKETESKKKSGIDVSKHQGHINWEELHDNHGDVKFVYIKATEGSDYVDPCYYENITNARKNGIKVGSYHYLTTRSSISTQFENFRKTVKIEDQDLIPVIDCEMTGGWTSQQLRDSLSLFANMIEQHLGCKPMILTFEKFFNIHLGRTFSNYPLWIAKYSTSEPNIGYDWTLWQFSDKCRISGVKSNRGLVDASVFNKKKSIKDILLKPK